jgi:hypothetical protein
MLRTLLVLSLPVLLLACDKHAGTGTGREPDEYVGCASDELWPRFDDVADVVGDADAPRVIEPTAGTELPSTAPAFVWSASPTLRGSDAGDAPSTCAQWNTGFTTLHLAPVSGTIYDLQVLVGGVAEHRVITTLQRWVAPPDAWAALAGKQITVELRRIVVLNNDRKEGPYVATTPFTATVAGR